MGSLTAISYQLGSLTIELPAKAAKGGMLQSNDFTFNQVLFSITLPYTLLPLSVLTAVMR
jgi:hypothetical protein